MYNFIRPIKYKYHCLLVFEYTLGFLLCVLIKSGSFVCMLWGVMPHFLIYFTGAKNEQNNEL